MSTAAASTRKKVMNRPAMNSVDKSVIAILPGSSGQPLDNSTFQPEIANFVALSLISGLGYFRRSLRNR